eukprot:TRINITY_DN49356_c0_g1_i1.p1 TRINITY_DN49356_c0_g1~~TRINITY_DN49356_c0_g1_i1.p1  ORF type:complete len:346 (+),score=53.09 TRINITY_DN49356_c0_g1_i1:41-1039(+)
MRSSILWLALCATFGLRPAAAEPQNFEAFKFVSGFFGFDAAREKGGGPTTLSLIGAGFSRTGTKSLEAALLRLGHKVYDTRSMLELGHTARWEDAAKEYKAAGNVTLIEALLEEMERRGYTTTLDFPMNLFAPILARQRPAAKVLMSVRPSEDSWVEAWATVNQILSIFILRPWSWLIDMEFNKRILKTLYDFDFEYPAYPEHIARKLPWFEVAERFPAFESDDAKLQWKKLHQRLQLDLQSQLSTDRFMTFDVRSGWAPLLEFLGVDDPSLASEPFPRVNDRSSLQVVRTVMDVVAIFLPLWITLVLYLSYRCIAWLLRLICGRTQKEKLG